METHGIHTRTGRKEISCSDCGHSYLIAEGQPSGTCKICGNIEFLSSGKAESKGKGLAFLGEEIALRRILPRIHQIKTETAFQEPKLDFSHPPDGDQVENIRMTYQVEWQLWAALVKNFESHAHHMAYITQAIATEKADKACERYREHRSVMSLLPDSRWQAEVADLMLSRVEAISVARMQAYRKRPTVPEVVAHFQKVLFEARFSKIFWVAAGMILFARLLNYEVGGF